MIGFGDYVRLKSGSALMLVTDIACVTMGEFADLLIPHEPRTLICAYYQNKGQIVECGFFETSLELIRKNEQKNAREH